MKKHRYDANDPRYRILYNHFNQPGPVPLALGLVFKRLIALISLHPGLDKFPTPLILQLLPYGIAVAAKSTR
jgi:hypothetical protein